MSLVVMQVTEMGGEHLSETTSRKVDLEPDGVLTRTTRRRRQTWRLIFAPWT